MKEPQLSFTIQPKYLSAVSLFAGTDEVRYAICGVNVDWNGERLLLVATDGRRIFVLNATEQAKEITGPATSFIIPNLLLRGLPQPSRKGAPLIVRKVEDKVEIEGNKAISAPCILANYPDWKKAIPKEAKNTFSDIFVNLSFLEPFCKAYKILVGESCVRIVQAGDKHGPLIILPSRNLDAVGVLMPMRPLDEPYTAPAWAISTENL
jgi:DNA polymerase III sliding clamp (beta) subunit (PCNA family)